MIEFRSVVDFPDWVRPPSPCSTRTRSFVGWREQHARHGVTRYVVPRCPIDTPPAQAALSTRSTAA